MKENELITVDVTDNQMLMVLDALKSYKKHLEISIIEAHKELQKINELMERYQPPLEVSLNENWFVNS